ncbi:MAG: hypothetical protein Q8N46_04815 [Anaerolineales bacterium]|nr:hypothetical protein [Anaerolineales bacterium]
MIPEISARPTPPIFPAITGIPKAPIVFSLNRYGKLYPINILLFGLEMEGHMVSYDDAKVTASTSVNIENQETRIEKLLIETGQEKIRLSSWSGGDILSRPLVLSEAELLELLHQAIHAGVLPRNFIGKLRERIEI